MIFLAFLAMVYLNPHVSISGILCISAYFRHESTFRSSLVLTVLTKVSLCSNAGHTFSCGVTLAKLAAVTVDEQGNETFDTSGALDRLRKVSRYVIFVNRQLYF